MKSGAEQIFVIFDYNNSYKEESCFKRMNVDKRRKDLTRLFTNELKDDVIIKEAAARKAAKILVYLGESRREGKEFPLHKRLPEIWRGMKEFEIEPYIEKFFNLESLDFREKDIYHELDSIAIGAGVCIEKGLLNVCEHTNYSVSAKGVEFIDICYKKII